ncbi:accessory Sec system glycosylation chaperone GtfB [Mammaliicoccus sciuri]|uniref:accessory Sec system glycosylation chaperone GtfB n=1 Tax=Mammaliicoccus sciuri TaxID=1296 RepID=UPI0034DD6DBF
MINLFESFDAKTKVLYKTFENTDINNQSIVIEEDGFLPSGILTPYQFFAEYKNGSSGPLYFNKVPIPRFWEIEGNNNSAEIKNMGEIKGRIIYKKNFGFRSVDRIEWLNKQGKTQVIDYYNKNGFKYAQLLLNDEQRRVIKRWFNQNNQEIITENFITNDIILNWNDKEYIFHSKVQFIIFYLKSANLSLESFLINSLSLPCAVLYDLKEEGNDYLFWQEKIPDKLPGNMNLLLRKRNRNCRIITPNTVEYSKLQELVSEEQRKEIFKLGYVFNFVGKNQQTNNVLTLTNSDQIPKLEEIAKNLPEYNFHIVALTEMSPKLTKLGSYPNVQLFPNASRDKIRSLYKECDIYLDINKGNEILDAVKSAFDYQLLIFGYVETLHNENYVYNDNLYLLEEYDKLIQCFRSLNKLTMNDRLINQLKYAGSVTKKNFLNNYNKLV